MSTPIYPIMDNLDLETWFFFVPCRILWSQIQRPQGRDISDPLSAADVSAEGGFAALSLYPGGVHGFIEFAFALAYAAISDRRCRAAAHQQIEARQPRTRLDLAGSQKR